MGKRALVILGAGAANDLVPVVDGQSLGTDIGKYRPPLTKDLFRDNELTKETLDEYQGARILVGAKRFDLLEEENLESLLYELSNADDLPRAELFPEVPLFLQDLFGRISTNYTNQPVNYARLADELFKKDSGFEQIAFVTLNYDTLLEQVLAPFFLGEPIKTMGSYITNKCLLVKLHGSVDWAERLSLDLSLDTTRRTLTIRQFGREEYLGLIHALRNAGLRQARTGDISLRPPTDLWDHSFHNNLPRVVYYPALAVPVGKYDKPICPPAHIEALKEFLGGCRNVLAIGVSGKDLDLLKLLEENLPKDVHSFWLVDKGKNATMQALRNFVDGCPKLIGRWPQGLNPPPSEGFTDFIRNPKWGLDAFITGSQ